LGVCVEKWRRASDTFHDHDMIKLGFTTVEDLLIPRIFPLYPKDLPTLVSALRSHHTGEFNSCLFQIWS
jgi:hypothetical protein